MAQRQNIEKGWEIFPFGEKKIEGWVVIFGFWGKVVRHRWAAVQMLCFPLVGYTTGIEAFLI